MAIRPIFYVNEYHQTAIRNVSFTWYSGFAKSQVKKCVHSLHEASKFSNVLEVSRFSDDELGIQLSAFNLLDQDRISIECKYHASKVFENGGPYLDLLTKTSMEAKKDERIRNSGRCIGFMHEGKIIQSEHLDLFYNYIYISALVKHSDLASRLLNYYAFTDIKYNPQKSVACQAKACSIYVSLVRQGKLIEALKDIETFEKIVYGK